MGLRCAEGRRLDQLGFDARGVLDGLADAVVATDAAGRIVLANRAAEAMLGWPHRALEGQPLTVIQPRRAWPAYLHAVEAHLADPASHPLADTPMRLRAVRRDGDEFDVELTVRIHAPEGGSPLFVSVLRDMGDRAEIDRQLAFADDLRAATRIAAMLGHQREPGAVAVTVVTALVEQFRAVGAELWFGTPEDIEQLDAAGLPVFEGEGAHEAVPELVVRGLSGLRQIVAADAAAGHTGVQVVLPLTAGDWAHGVIACRFIDRPTDEHLEVLSAFAALVAAHLTETRLLAREREAQGETETAMRRSQFLQDAGSLLGASTVEASMERLARLAVPELADWCTVDLLAHDGRLERVAAAHWDAGREEILRDIGRRRPEQGAGFLGPSQVARSGRPQLLTDITDELLVDTSWDAEHLAALRELGPSCVACVPLVARGVTLGALTFALSVPGRAYNEDDVRLLETIAHDAALAVDNARLFDELREANRTSRESLALLDSLFGSAPVGLAIVDRDLRYVRLNEALAELHGVPIEQHLGRTATEVLGEFGVQVDQLRRRVLETGEPVFGADIGGALEGREGEQHWAVNYYPVRGAEGQVVGVGSIVVDITDRRRTQALLDDQRHFFEAVLENLTDGIVACDTDGRLTVFNRAMQRLHGIPSRDVSAGRWREHYDLFHADGVTRLRPHEEPLQRALRGEDVRDEEIVIVPKRGGRRVAVHNGQAITDEGGRRLGAVVALHDVTQRKAAESRLADQALHDPLTGLPNRVLLLDRMRLALARARRHGESVAALFLDLDRFKLVNDSFGHEVGDQLLRTVAERLRSAVRPSDTIARLGGDEFIVLCERLKDADQAIGLARRMEAAVAAPGLLPDDELTVTASVGVAIADGSESPEDLIRDADSAMYWAKEHGKARHKVFDDTVRAEAFGRLQTERALRRAIEGDGLRLLFQPVADLATGRLVGAEALLRYEDPELGLVAPADFLDVAEDSGLIVPIGQWVVSQACRQACEWDQLSRGRSLQVFVNLSARQLTHPALADAIEASLAETKLAEGTLSLDITETVLMEATSTTAGALDRLKHAGVRVGIDDFGTGYSSLTYLRRFPVDYVKVDSSFVAGVGIHDEDTAIVEAVVNLGHALGLVVVAEGVETSLQAAALRRMGCDLLQGFHVGRPAPGAAVTERLLGDRR